MFMKKLLLVVLVFVCSFVQAQCPFDVVISPSSPSICPNSTDTLWSSSATSYTWFRNGVPVVGGSQQFLVVSQQADAGASFVVVGTISGCSEASPAVTLTNAITQGASISIADGLSGFACNGDLRQLVLNDPYNENIRWFRDGVQLTGQTNDTLNVTQGGLYSAIAFTDVCPLYSQPAAGIQLNFANAVTPVISFNGSTLALSTSVQAQQYIWQINGDTVEDASGQVFLPQANGEVTLTAVFNPGCERTSQPYSYNSFVQNCDHDPTIFPEDLVLCPNESDTLFTQTADSYRWFRGGTLIEGAEDAFLVVNQFQDAGFSFQVESTLNGCAEMSPEVLVDGWVFLPLTVSTEGNLDPLCEGDALILEVLPPFTENIQWLFNGNPVQFGNELTLEITESGTYAVNASTEICPAYNETSINLDYTFQPRPQPVINYFQVSNTLSADVQAVSYVWMLDGEIIPGATTQIITPAAEGNYTVTATYSNGCSNVSEAYFYETVGIDQLQSSELFMHPNPAADFLWINLQESAFVQIFDMSGREVGRYDYTGQGFIDISSLESGTYLLSFTNRKQSSAVRQVLIKK
jgi:hypothetical protein